MVVSYTEFATSKLEKSVRMSELKKRVESSGLEGAVGALMFNKDGILGCE